MSIWRRRSLPPPHKPSIPLKDSRLLGYYAKGIEDAMRASFPDPGLSAQVDDREAYFAGFEKARE